MFQPLAPILAPKQEARLGQGIYVLPWPEPGPSLLPSLPPLLSVVLEKCPEQRSGGREAENRVKWRERERGREMDERKIRQGYQVKKERDEHLEHRELMLS